MKGLSGFVVLVACVATVGCGSSSGKKTDGGGGGGAGGGGSGGANGDAAVNTNCASFTACGGNIVGSWRYVSGCGVLSSSTCPLLRAMTMPAAGSQATYTFGSGGAFTYTFSGSITEMFSYALGCLSSVTDAGIPEACAELQNLYRTIMEQPDAGSAAAQLASATCTAGGNQTCDCVVVFTSQSPQTLTGSYTVSGNQVTINSTSSGSDGGVVADPPAAFCVSGNTLTIHFVNTDGSDFITTFTR